MSILLQADLRFLTQGQKFSYLAQNYASGVSSHRLTNSSGFATDDFVLLGEVGNETAEVMRVQTVTAATHTLTFTATTKFAHPESTRVTKIPYEQVRFYWTSTTTFSTGTPLTGWTDITPDDWFSKYTDTAHSTGYGWFVFRNSVTAVSTSNSNAIPYANFGRDTVKKAVDRFYSTLNNNDRKLVPYEDVMEWLNEGYDLARVELGMVNTEYGASEPVSVSVVSGTSEYALESDFGSMISVWDTDSGDVLEMIDVWEADDLNENATDTTPRWYIRGRYLGFAPTPTQAWTMKYRYEKLPTELTSYSDIIYLPKRAFTILNEWVTFRAKQKLRHPDAMSYRELFEAEVMRIKNQAVNRDNSLDSWGIADNANV